VRRAESVAGDARVEMVHVVEADVAGQPVQDARQAEPGRRLHRRLGRVPLRPPRPARGLEAVLQRPEIFRVVEEESDPTLGADLALSTLRQALKELERERVREGRALRGDFEQRVERLVAALPEIEKLAQQAREEIRANFEARMRELLGEAPINEKRLFEEALGAAHHGDISEEMTRLRIHLKAMGPLLRRRGAVGKSIEFLLQEINREINTIGAKSQDARMSQITVEMKGEVEKMREQVQNVE